MKRLFVASLFLLLASASEAQTFSYQAVTRNIVTAAQYCSGSTRCNIIGSGAAFHKLSWNVSGTLSACSVRVDGSADGTTWGTGDVVAAQTCTSNGTTTSTSTVVNYVRINVTTITPVSTATLTVNLTGYSGNPNPGGGSVTNIATTSPISGGPITTTGTLSCPTCGTVTNIATTAPLSGGPITTTGTISCPTCGTGTVTSIATTSPITGGTITGTGTIACATCLTTSALTNNSTSGGFVGPWGWRGFTYSGINTFANTAFGLGMQYTSGSNPAAVAVAATGTVPMYYKITETGTGATTNNGVVETNNSSVAPITTGGFQYFRMRVAALTTLGRYWLGFSTTTSVGTTTLVADTPNAGIIGWRFSTGAETTWKCVVQKDNANVSIADSTVSVDNTFHVFEILVSGSNYLFFIDGTQRCSVANTNQPLTTTGLFQIFSIDNQNTTSNNPSIALSYAWWYTNI